MKWIVALGIAVALVTILYAWYRGGEGASAVVVGAVAPCR